MKTRLLSPVLLLTGLLTGLLTCAARSDDVLVCGTEDSLTQQMNQTLGTPIATDSLVEARVVFVTFPDDPIQTRPTWAYGFRSEMADYIGTMSRGAQHLSILILNPSPDTTLAWVADHPASYYQSPSSYGALNAEIMTKIYNDQPGVWIGVKQVFMIHYRNTFPNGVGWAGVRGLACFGSGCAPGFTGDGTTQRIGNDDVNNPIQGEVAKFIAAHEYGHILGFAHSPNTQILIQDCAYVNMGRYDDMRGVASWVSDGGTVPYHPRHLLQAGWLSDTTVTTDAKDVRIPPMFTAAAHVVEVPVPGSNSQSYMLANYQQLTPYDTKFQNKGLLVWHILEGLAWDLESAAGKFVKTADCVLDPNQPDPVAGKDLIEACVSYSGSWNDFYDGTNHTVLGCNTNPNTNAYASDFCHPQSVAEPVAFDNIRREANGDMLVDIYVTPAQRVTAPNGTEVIAEHQPYTITWAVRSSACVSSVDLLLSSNGGASYAPLATGLSNTGSYVWTPDGTGSQYRIQVKSYGSGGGSGTDASDANFTVADVTPPSAITNLAPTMGRVHSVVTWTAPGDDGTTGTATAFDLRWSNSSIDAGNFGSATQLVTADPGPPGTQHCSDLATTRCRTYYFAIKTRDEAGNWSALSNVPLGYRCDNGQQSYYCDVMALKESPEEDRGSEPAPTRVELRSPIPNPAQRSARLSYGVPAGDAGAAVELSIFDALGRRVRQLEQSAAVAGWKDAVWDLRSDAGSPVRSGLYFARLHVGARMIRTSVLVTR